MRKKSYPFLRQVSWTRQHLKNLTWNTGTDLKEKTLAGQQWCVVAVLEHSLSNLILCCVKATEYTVYMLCGVYWHFCFPLSSLTLRSRRPRVITSPLSLSHSLYFTCSLCSSLSLCNTHGLSHLDPGASSEDSGPPAAPAE